MQNENIVSVGRQLFLNGSIYIFKTAHCIFIPFPQGFTISASGCLHHQPRPDSISDWAPTRNLLRLCVRSRSLLPGSYSGETGAWETFVEEKEDGNRLYPHLSVQGHGGLSLQAKGWTLDWFPVHYRVKHMLISQTIRVSSQTRVSGSINGWRNNCSDLSLGAEQLPNYHPVMH